MLQPETSSMITLVGYVFQSYDSEIFVHNVLNVKGEIFIHNVLNVKKCNYIH